MSPRQRLQVRTFQERVSGPDKLIRKGEERRSAVSRANRRKGRDTRGQKIEKLPNGNIKITRFNWGREKTLYNGPDKRIAKPRKKQRSYKSKYDKHKFVIE
ncbi:MAG: hypothetical protein ABID38_00630 [Candidatus Diapherotrites archaeon]